MSNPLQPTLFTQLGNLIIYLFAQQELRVCSSILKDQDQYSTRMSSRPFVFFAVLTGISVLSTVVVVGFSIRPLSSSHDCRFSFRAITTTLRYVAETNYHEEQYHRSRPFDMKVVDVEIEGNSQSVYIPMNEMDDAINRAKETHEQDCANLQNTIDEQKEELNHLKERNRKSRLADKLQYDHLVEDAEVNWGENQKEKVKRTADRVRFLTDENERLQVELDGERQRFELEKGRFKIKLEEARDETTEAERILSLERSYFETAIKLLETGLERENKNVERLEDQLLQYNQLEYHENHNHPRFHEDLPPSETWEGPGAYEQRQDHFHHEFHHHPQTFEGGFEEFQPQVRPQKGAHHYTHDDYGLSQHEVLFQTPEPQIYHQQHDGQSNEQHSYFRPNAHERPLTATTTVMGASSIRDNLGINDVRDPLYR